MALSTKKGGYSTIRTENPLPTIKLVNSDSRNMLQESTLDPSTSDEI
jgi:hypothetical protein